jgi:multimeric flavodoxin WrbA
MKIVAFNGSPRKQGNTYSLLRIVSDELEKAGIETEIINITGEPLRGCMACNKCVENKNNKCVITTDSINTYIEKMIEADGILLGSPTYFSNVTAEIKAFIDRTGKVNRANNGFLKRKVGAAVVAARRGGALITFNSINQYFLISEMIVPGSNYWNMGIGLHEGDVNTDEEGILTMRLLGENMAWLLKQIHP